MTNLFGFLHQPVFFLALLDTLVDVGDMDVLVPSAVVGGQTLVKHHTIFANDRVFGNTGGMGAKSIIRTKLFVDGGGECGFHPDG